MLQEPELAEMLAIGALDFDRADDDDSFAAELARNESNGGSPLPSPHAVDEGSVLDFSVAENQPLLTQQQPPPQ